MSETRARRRVWRTRSGVRAAKPSSYRRTSAMMPRRLFATVDRTLGTVTALVNNAGILETQCRLEDVDEERLLRILRVNVVGTFLPSREAVRRMSTRRGGKGGVIVNVSSAASRTGSPGEYLDYAASKGAIDTFTHGLALCLLYTSPSPRDRTRSR